jgi:hypothetical protein
MLLSVIQTYQKLALSYMIKILFRMSNPGLWSWSLVLDIFRDLCFTIGHFQASDYKSAAYKKKGVLIKKLMGVEITGLDLQKY